MSKSQYSLFRTKIAEHSTVNSNIIIDNKMSIYTKQLIIQIFFSEKIDGSRKDLLL